MYVYWLYDIACSMPQTEGYVGVTNNIVRRMREHRRKRKGFQTAVLLDGTDEECFSLERELRPRPGIGWNNGAGGPDARKSGHSEATRKKIGDGHRGNKRLVGRKLSPEHRANIAVGMKAVGFKPSRKAIEAGQKALAALPPPMLGKKHKPDTIDKMKSAAQRRIAEGRGGKGQKVGFRHSEETKAKIRAKRSLQADPRLGKKHSDESKLKMSKIAKKLNETRSRDGNGRFLN